MSWYGRRYSGRNTGSQVESWKQAHEMIDKARSPKTKKLKIGTSTVLVREFDKNKLPCKLTIKIYGRDCVTVTPDNIATVDMAYYIGRNRWNDIFNLAYVNRGGDTFLVPNERYRQGADPAKAGWPRIQYDKPVRFDLVNRVVIDSDRVAPLVEDRAAATEWRGLWHTAKKAFRVYVMLGLHQHAEPDAKLDDRELPDVDKAFVAAVRDPDPLALVHIAFRGTYRKVYRYRYGGTEPKYPPTAAEDMEKQLSKFYDSRRNSIRAAAGVLKPERDYDREDTTVPAEAGSNYAVCG